MQLKSRGRLTITVQFKSGAPTEPKVERLIYIVVDSSESLEEP